MGFIPQRQEGYFCLRLKVVGGAATAETTRRMAELAEKFGSGKLHFTSRQSVEIPFIKLENTAAMTSAVIDAGLSPANLGPGIRTVAACQGADICRSGLIPSQKKAQMLYAELADFPNLPHKFKIGITGCHNNCLKAEEHCLGLKGALIPRYSAPENCTKCGICQKACPANAITVSETGLQYEPEKCLHCGRCYNKCPEKCWSGQAGTHLFFGGTFGNSIQKGRSLGGTITDDETLIKTIKKALSYFAAKGKPGERFGKLIERMGWDDFQGYMEGN